MKEDMENQTSANGWSRQELTLRLSRRRLAKLKAIAASLPIGTTPTEAIDHAIDRARFDSADLGSHFAELAVAVDEEGERSRLADERIEARVKALAHSVDALRTLISAIAADE